MGYEGDLKVGEKKRGLFFLISKPFRSELCWQMVPMRGRIWFMRCSAGWGRD